MIKNPPFDFKILILLVLLLLLQFSPVSAEIVWEEDFETGPFDDWTLKGYEEKVDDFLYLTNVTPRIENGRLQMIDDTFPNVAFRNSTVAYGTWSFDWIVPPDIELYNNSKVRIVFFFVSNIPIYLNGSQLIPPTLNAYQLLLTCYYGTEENWHLYIEFGEYNYGIWNGMETYFSPDIVTGVFHIDITRDTDGTFKLYTNSSRVPIFEKVNNRIKTSERIAFMAWRNKSAIDNIVVDDEVVITSDTKSTPFFGIEVLLVILPLSIIYSYKRRH